MYVSSVFRGMLQLLHMDVIKVDRDVAHAAYVCKCFQCYVASVLKKMFSGICCDKCFYLDVAYVSHTCCKCFVWMLHMFHTHVASVLSRYCICFTHMLQVFYLDVVYVSHICCNSIFQMFCLCLTYVASKCFMLQVFDGSTMSMEKIAGYNNAIAVGET
jgi:hypothetical protein